MTADLFLFGCSHAGRLQKGAEVIGLRVAGGALMRGRLWDEDAFAFDPSQGLSFADPMARARLSAALAAAGASRLEDVRLPIVTTLGFQLDLVQDEISRRHTLARDPDDARDFITTEALSAIVAARREPLLDLLGWLAAGGATVVLVAPPARHPDAPLAAALETIVAGEAARRGVRMISPRPWSTGPDGRLRPEFEARKDGDTVHGNAYFGARAMAEVAAALGLPVTIPAESLASADAFDAYAQRSRRLAARAFAG
ncbi:hypothetical protein ACFSCV_10750 [Methylopila henanensis]|uniref:SGNH/GDSL hydrolase family protein n=1 Tax=Methylopila henanensis TaxID=873516 RepID=A0ABW4KA13_9HYPH